MSRNSGSLILGSTETEATVKSEIVKWLKQVPGEEKNLVDFWKERKDECDTLEFEKGRKLFYRYIEENCRQVSHRQFIP